MLELTKESKNKNQLLLIKHQRKGTFKAVAIRDFDTETETFYPVAMAQKKTIFGITIEWRNSFSANLLDGKGK